MPPRKLFKALLRKSGAIAKAGLLSDQRRLHRLGGLPAGCIEDRLSKRVWKKFPASLRDCLILHSRHAKQSGEKEWRRQYLRGPSPM